MKLFKKKDSFEPENKYQEIKMLYVYLDSEYLYLEEVYNKALGLKIIDEELSNKYYKTMGEAREILNNVVYRQISAGDPKELLEYLENYETDASNQILFSDYIERIENDNVDNFKPIEFKDSFYDKKKEVYKKKLKALELLFSQESGEAYLQDMIDVLEQLKSNINNLTEALEELINAYKNHKLEDGDLEEIQEVGDIVEQYANILGKSS